MITRGLTAFLALAFFCCFISVNISAYAQDLPPIQNFTLDDYNAGSQNWSVSQSDDKHIFIGNNKGLLEYNGADWNLYASPNGTIIRAVHYKDDLIYSGCYMEFGYWKRNDLGSITPYFGWGRIFN